MAKEKGLVDVLGGFDDAIEIAAKKAGIEEDYKLVVYPKQKSMLEQIMEDFGTDVESTYQRIKMGQSYEIFKTLEKLEKLQGRMVLLPFQSEIK